MWTKGQLVTAAFDELGLAGYEFDVQPDEVMSALRRMDSMMAMWDSKGIRIGYQLTVDPQDTDPDQDSGLSDTAVEAVFLNVAIRIASSYGKTPMQATKVIARESYEALLSAVTAEPPRMNYPRDTPAGAGNRQWSRRRVFLPTPAEPITTGPDGALEL